MLKKLVCVGMVVGIFSGCSTVPLEKPARQKPIDLLIEPEKYETAETVEAVPVVYVENMEKAGLCRVNYIDLIKWVNAVDN